MGKDSYEKSIGILKKGNDVNDLGFSGSDFAVYHEAEYGVA